MKKYILILSVIFGLAGGCCPCEREKEASQAYRSSLTPEKTSYFDGWWDGCPCGYVAAGHPYCQFSKNIVRYKNDSFYKQGWDDSFITHKGNYEALGAALNSR